jgi:hypothetical protein
LGVGCQQVGLARIGQIRDVRNFHGNVQRHHRPRWVRNNLPVWLESRTTIEFRTGRPLGFQRGTKSQKPDWPSCQAKIEW